MNEMETTEFDNELDEAAAAETLKPGAGSGGAGDSKSATLATFTTLLSQLGKDDLSKLFNDVQAQFGPNKAPGAEDKSAENLASIKTKPSAAVKEDIADMFSNDDLSEEFREKAEVVFEAALNTRLTLETVRLEEELEAKVAEMQEEFDNKLQEEASNIFEDVSSKLDQYLDYCIEQWMDDNKIAIENTLRADIAESFIGDLHNLFTQHYITVPEQKVDIVAEMKNELEELKAKLNETLDEKIALQSVIDEATMDATFVEVSEGLVETQIEKLRTLSEGIDYSDAETYRKKLNIVKESYFSGKKPSVSTGFITEEIDGSDSDVESTPATPAHMAKYVQAITKAAK